MRILVIGSGGREHALVWKIAQSPRVSRVFCAPGNGGIASLAECVPIKADDVSGLLAFVRKESIDLTVVGPEAPLVAGIADIFEAAGLKIFGPSQRAAELEASKSFSKRVMRSCGVPTADFAVCASLPEVRTALARFGAPVVVKADGLAAGKGVIVSASAQEAMEAAQRILVDKDFGEAGRVVVIEECLAGEEVSILALTNGLEAVPLASAQDHKRIFDGDKGPNTGGMGAYSPAPVATPALVDEVMRRVVTPVIHQMRKDGVRYRGILYAGIMVTKKGPQVLEFNARFGDPETQAVLVRLESDLVEAMLWSLTDDAPPALAWRPEASVCVVASAGGYPGPYEKGKVIEGLDDASRMKDVVVFHAGTKKLGDRTVTDGGRVLGITARGADVRRAIDTAYAAASRIHFDGMHYRRDIGWRALKRS